MHRRIPLFLPAILFSLLLRASGGEYAVSGIPAALLKNAHLVKRISITEYEIISYTKTRIYEKYALTILDEGGLGYASLYKYYDKLRSVRSIEGKLFDAEGREIRSAKNRDIRDLSAVSAISLMEDSRVKVHDFHFREYPFTVEYEIVTEYNNTYIMPGWFPQPAEGYAVEKASLTVKCPSWFDFQYRMFNYGKGGPVIAEKKDGKDYGWSVEHLPAVVKEYAAPDWPNLSTGIFFSPVRFEIEGYTGSLATWKEMGFFQLALNKGRDILPDNEKQEVHRLTDGLTDTREKIRVLYEHLQQRTRYISIQLGIGGYQPFDAAYVAKNAYGDCKALSNFMYSLLKEAGIRSYYTLVRSGEGEFFFTPEFAQDQFNHIILCVPLAKDTVWLECTSQTLPAGYLGGHTCNRYALLVTEDGGQLARTPRYGLKENFQVRNIRAMLDETGTLQVNARSLYSGLQQDSYHRLIHQLSKEKVKEALQEYLDFPTYDIRSFDYKETRSALPLIAENLDIVVSNYAAVTGKRLFVMPNIMTRSGYKLTNDTARKYEIDLRFEYKDTDSVEISLPPGYLPEAIPKEVVVSSKFGKYNSTVLLRDDKLFYFRTMEHYSGRYPAGDYPELVKFYETIYKADRGRVVLVKHE